MNHTVAAFILASILAVLVVSNVFCWVHVAMIWRATRLELDALWRIVRTLVSRDLPGGHSDLEP